MGGDEEDAGCRGSPGETHFMFTHQREVGLLPTISLFSLLQLHQCPSACFIRAAFPITDSGVYWCETGLGETSDTVNITVSGEREASVTLCCRMRQKIPLICDV